MKTIYLVSLVIILVLFSSQVKSQCVDPEPTIYPDSTSVCGTYHEISIENVEGTGYWTAYEDGEPIEPVPVSDISSPNITIDLPELEDYFREIVFVWTETITDGADEWTGTASQTVIFYKKPIAYAWEDDAVCGLEHQLSAEFSLQESDDYSSSGLWIVAEKPDPNASSNIINQSSPNSDVMVSHYGVWKFAFRESNSLQISCFDRDTVTIEFVEIPYYYVGEDADVCGNCVELIPGQGELVTEGISINPDNDTVCVLTYGPKDLVWRISNPATTMDFECVFYDTVTVTFWREPTATILTDIADSTTCCLSFSNLSAVQLGFWWSPSEGDYWPSPIEYNPTVSVSAYGYHDFYWIVTNGPSYNPSFCVDTAGPLTIHFIENPIANAGNDTVFCGYQGGWSAIPSVGNGTWSSSSQLVSFGNENDPNSDITSEIINTGNPSNPYFRLFWTEDHLGCTDSDTIEVVFARIPRSKINIVPPKCFGEVATLSADEDSIGHYDWNFYGGIVDSTCQPNMMGGLYEYYVRWTNGESQHIVSLIATNYWGCSSPITIDTVYEPTIPQFEVEIISDTCLMSSGAIQINDDNSFYWLNPNVGPAVGTLINNLPNKTVSNLPADDYDIRVVYPTPNMAWYSYYTWVFGDANCIDTLNYFVPSYSVFDMFCPDDIYITSYQNIELTGGTPWGGKYYLNGNEITHFNSEQYDNGVYTIRYYYHDTASDCESFCQFKIIVEIPSDIQKTKLHTFAIYPNPNSGEFTIECGEMQNAVYEIYDVQGRIIVKEHVSDNQKTKNISLDLKSGIYYLRLLNDKGIFTERFVVK